MTIHIIRPRDGKQVAAVTSFEAVEAVSRAHIVADICNGHQQPPATASQGLCIDCIVEVASILTIDRHQRNVSQVDSAL